MKKILWYAIVPMFAGAVALIGTSHAGIFDSYGKPKEKAPATQMEEPATPPAATKESLPTGQIVTLSGTIDEHSHFVSDKGVSYALSDSEKSKELKALTGKSVEIKGTVMEEEGKKTVEVKEYNILK